MPTQFAERYREAMRQAGGACPIESGVLGRLADHECAHGRLAGDRTPKVRLLAARERTRHRTQPAAATAARQTEGRLTRDGERRSHAPLSNRRLHRAGAARAAHVSAALAAGAGQAQTGTAPRDGATDRAPAAARTARRSTHASTPRAPAATRPVIRTCAEWSAGSSPATGTPTTSTARAGTRKTSPASSK